MPIENDDEDRMRVALGFSVDDWKKNKAAARDLEERIKAEDLKELQSGKCSHRFTNKWLDGFNLVCKKCGHKILRGVTNEQHNLL